jgi:hypothetical protein
MKKIFTLLFFAGFLTTGFSQSRRDQSDGNRNPSSGYSKPSNQGGDRNYQSNARDNERDYAYNQDRNNDRDHGYEKGGNNWNDRDNRDNPNRDDMKRGHDRDYNYGNQRQPEYSPRTGGSLLQIILSGTIRL